MTTSAILLFSHGSVLCGSEGSLLELARAMESRGDAAVVEAGFLDYSEPRFETALARCVERGATRITIAPWFLSAGKFVTEELPARIQTQRERYPHVGIVVADAIRRHPLLVDVILDSARRPREPRHWRDLATLQAAANCRESPRCPLHGTTDCPASGALAADASR